MGYRWAFLVSLAACVWAAPATSRWAAAAPDRRGTPAPKTEKVFRAVAFSPDGRLLAAGGTHGAVAVWEVRSPQRLQKLPAGADVLSLAFSPRGDRLAAGCEDGRVRLWKVGRGRFARERTLRCRCRVKALAFSPDGKVLACGTGGAGNIHLYDPAAGALRRTLWEASNGIEALAFLPNGKTLLSAGNGLKFWDLAAAAVKPDEVEGLQISLEELRRREARLVRMRRAGYWVVGVAASPDGRLVASAGHLPGQSGDAPKSLALWDARTGELRRTLAKGPGEMTAVVFAPDGRTVAASSKDGVVRLWEVASGKLLRRWRAPAGEVQSVAFSADGALLAGAGNALYLWDAKTGARKARLTWE